MPKRTNEYQQLVYLIHEQLKDRPDTVVTESKMLIDRVTGDECEADVIVDTVASGVPIVIAVDCRTRSHPAGAAA